MLTRKIIIICCALSLYEISYAQDAIDCANITYTYYERNSAGYLVHKCSAQSLPNVANVKQAMPFYLCIDDYYLYPALNSSVHRNICDLEDFSAKFRSAVEAAMAKWNSICPSGEVDFKYGKTPNCSGEIEAVLSKTNWKSQYTGTPLLERNYYAEAWPGAIANDGLKRSPRIIMNFTKELSENYVYPGYTAYGKVWAFSGQCSSQGPGSQCDCEGQEGKQYDKVCLSVETVILHELGHLLGLGHPSSIGCNGSTPSIMNNAVNLAEMFNKSVEKADRCAIKNIYCPGSLTAVDEFSRHSYMVEMYPNPTKSGVMLECPKSWQVNRIVVHNELGVITSTMQVRNIGVPIYISEESLSRGINVPFWEGQIPHL